MTQSDKPHREWLLISPSDSDLQEGNLRATPYSKLEFPPSVWSKRVEQAKDRENGITHVIEKSAYDAVVAELATALEGEDLFEKELTTCEKEYSKLEAERDKYKAALEFYATKKYGVLLPEDWNYAKMGGPPQYDSCYVDPDNGEVARQALAAEGKV